MKNNVAICYILLLSSVSVWLVLLANDEPYTVFRASDAFIQVGLGVTLIVLWFQFSIWLAHGVIKRHLPMAWLTAYFWILVVLFYLWHTPTGYVEDITKFVIEKR